MISDLKFRVINVSFMSRVGEDSFFLSRMDEGHSHCSSKQTPEWVMVQSEHLFLLQVKVQKRCFDRRVALFKAMTEAFRLVHVPAPHLRHMVFRTAVSHLLLEKGCHCQ